jgi:hypothetical protein
MALKRASEKKPFSSDVSVAFLHEYLINSGLDSRSGLDKSTAPHTLVTHTTILINKLKENKILMSESLVFMMATFPSRLFS